MVATTDCVEKSKPVTGNKVSKPLMEKKRRARINQCLDQLKSLLESYYSSSIRKRKLEKADILELTVKHLRNLQKIQSCTAAASEFSDYQSGFRSCLANVNQYLLMAEHSDGSDRWMLSQISNKLCRSRRREVSSTTDSNLAQAEARNEARKLPASPAAPEEERVAKFKPGGHHGAGVTHFVHGEDARQSPEIKQAVLFALPSRNTKEKCCTPNKVHSVSDRIEAANTHHSVWRPW
ncbi:hairy-related 3 [Mugil cephalus]|uniref:hairy-related 3 n=1 Tax=Mugil cephalus TaxID=48193 RepID=UPI001FB6FF46|nr:hairy-related 3 [Mugil cephalus]